MVMQDQHRAAPKRRSTEYSLGLRPCASTRSFSSHGMTVTEVVEDALRGYIAATEPQAVGTLVRRESLLVRPAGRKRKIKLAEAEAALEATRSRIP